MWFQSLFFSLTILKLKITSELGWRALWSIQIILLPWIQQNHLPLGHSWNDSKWRFYYHVSHLCHTKMSTSNPVVSHQLCTRCLFTIHNWSVCIRFYLSHLAITEHLHFVDIFSPTCLCIWTSLTRTEIEIYCFQLMLCC